MVDRQTVGNVEWGRSTCGANALAHAPPGDNLVTTRRATSLSGFVGRPTPRTQRSFAPHIQYVW